MGPYFAKVELIKVYFEFSIFDIKFSDVFQRKSKFHRLPAYLITLQCQV